MSSEGLEKRCGERCVFFVPKMSTKNFRSTVRSTGFLKSCSVHLLLRFFEKNGIPKLDE